MAHYTLIARINAGDGKFPFVNVQFSKNHRPIPIEGATYFLRPSSRGKRTPIKIGKDVAAAYTALVRREDGEPLEHTAALHAAPPPRIPNADPRNQSRPSCARLHRAQQAEIAQDLLGVSRRRQLVRRQLQENLLRRDLPRRLARLSCQRKLRSIEPGFHFDFPADRYLRRPVLALAIEESCASTTVPSGRSANGST
jgi:hypothetical protein